MKKLLFLLTIVFALIPVIPVRANTNDFSISNNMEIRYNKGNKYVDIEVEYVRRVLNSSYFLPAEGDKTFFIPDLQSQTEEERDEERKFKEDSISVVDVNGNSINFSTTRDDGGINVIVPNYKQTTRNSPYRIFLRYKTHDYVKVINNSVIIQGPSLPKDTEFVITHSDSNTKTKIDFKLNILVDENTPSLAKIWPEGYESSKENGYYKYYFPSNLRLGQNPYLEFGTKQIYRFEYEYTTPRTSSILPEKYSNIFSALYKNILEISLPRFFDETNQIVKIEEITPSPDKMTRDVEGNIIATFEVDTNKETKISITGFIQVEQQPYDSKKNIPNPTISEYLQEINKDPLLKDYLKPTKYWQSDNEYILEIANEIKANNTNILDLIKDNYKFVIDNLEYDDEKVEVFNNRLGALEALNIGSGVCMEYADSMLALLRAQGIPSRAALGYANLMDFTDTPESQVRHQWVQIWIPDYGWLSVDPTWESENMDIGQNINRVLWETFNNDNLSNNRIYSADNLDAVSNIDFHIKVFSVNKEDIEEIEGLMTYEDIIPLEEGLEESNLRDWANKFFKASTLGRSVSIVIPILVVLLILILVISIVRFVFKKVRRKKES